ncbi:MAG: RHS repeat-associated core domain-containing protein [Rhodanobacter sp.]
MDIQVRGRAVYKMIAYALVLLMLWLGGVVHAGTVTYVYTDAQGTPLAEADASGNITATFDYAPYGSQALGTAPSGPGYTGHVNDPDTGLVYMQARYYDPAVGRFLSVDPVGSVPGNAFNFNRYSYANNSPYKYIDPDGRESVGEIIDSGAQGCGSVSCAGWAVAYSFWTVLGAEGISQAYDKGWSNAGTGRRIGAAFEVIAVLPPVKLLKGVPLAYKIAAEGGEHAGFLARQMEKNVGQLRKTIRSLERQISLHEDKIRNPAKYMTRDDPSISGHVERAVSDWKSDIKRQTKQLDITKEVLNQKSSVCTGTHLVGKC